MEQQSYGGENEMRKIPQLIVMLTHNDQTVQNASDIFEQCKDSKAKIWGFKEEPLPLEEMKKLYARMKECGMTTALEVVAYTEEECINGAKIGAECGCDFLMGTIYYDSVQAICDAHHMKYMPFVGEVTGRPSVLEGSIEGMIAEANDNLKKGASGVDLLGYRYTGDARQLNREMAAHARGPVCIAGSIDSYERLDEVIEAQADYFTIGSAFMEHRFGGEFCQQIDAVCDYLENHRAAASPDAAVDGDGDV